MSAKGLPKVRVSAVRIVVAFGLLLLASCKEKPSLPAAPASITNTVATDPLEEAPKLPSSPAISVDWSKSNTVSIVLGEESEYGGLKHHEKERDGVTTMVKVDDVSCRLLNHKGNGRSEAFLYFSIDPAFKTAGVTNVKVEVDYFDVVLDETPTIFGIHYDASDAARTLSSRYRNAGRTIVLSGANQWKTATFSLRNATFNNGENGQADFRIFARPPELYVRKVTVTRVEERVPSASVVRPGPFSRLPPSSFPGRYKLIEDGKELGIVELHPNNSLTNWRDETGAGYRWNVQPATLSLVWLNESHVFTRVIRPGVFEGQKLGTGKRARLEHQE